MGYDLSAMQEKYIKINNLQVSEKLSNFVNDELLKNQVKKMITVDYLDDLDYTDKNLKDFFEFIEKK